MTGQFVTQSSMRPEMEDRYACTEYSILYMTTDQYVNYSLLQKLHGGIENRGHE